MQLNESVTEVASNGLRASIPGILPALEARALRLTRSRPDAEDLLQETVIRALRFERTFQSGTNLRAWMQQILQSVFISRCRRRVRERRALERFTGDPTLTNRVTTAPILNCVSERMHGAYFALPDRFRSVVELVDLGDYSYREAAEALEVPVGTVMSRLFRARRMLEDSLASERDGQRPLRRDHHVPHRTSQSRDDQTPKLTDTPQRRRASKSPIVVPAPRPATGEPPKPAQAA